MQLRRTEIDPDCTVLGTEPQITQNPTGSEAVTWEEGTAVSFKRHMRDPPFSSLTTPGRVYFNYEK